MPLLILCYHGVNDKAKITKQIFEANLKTLQKKKYATASLDEIYDYVKGKTELPDKTVHITFDDGYRDNYSEVYPIMKKYPFKATIFLPTMYIGSLGFLNWDQIREMEGSGIFNFESHTHSHPRSVTINPSKEELIEDILISKKIIQKELNKESKHFCYPFGYYDDQYIEALKASGFHSAYTLNLGVNSVNENPYLLKRIEVKKPDNWLEKLLYIYENPFLFKIYKFLRKIG